MWFKELKCSVCCSELKMVIILRNCNQDNFRHGIKLKLLIVVTCSLIICSHVILYT